MGRPKNSKNKTKINKQNEAVEALKAEISNEASVELVEEIVEEAPKSILDDDFQIEEESDEVLVIEDSDLSEDITISVEDPFEEIKPEKGRIFLMALVGVTVCRHCVEAHEFISLNKNDKEDLIRNMLRKKQVCKSSPTEEDVIHILN